MEVVKALKNKIETIESLKEKYGIVIREYSDRYVLNYDQIFSHDYIFHPFVRECRQLILRKNDFFVLHRSFDRFYNYLQDPQSKKFDFINCQIDEKLDGSIIGLYNDFTKWCISTRSTAFGELPINNSIKTFSDVITEFINLDNFYNTANKELSYIFEFTSPYNKVVKPYLKPRLVLLAVRNKKTGEYLDRYIEGEKCGIKDYPIIYNYKSIKEIQDSLNDLPSHDEGYVCCHNDWRIKVKNPAFLAIIAIRKNGSLGIRKIIEMVHNYEEDEYLTYYPEDKYLFDPYIKIRENMEDYFNDLFNKHKNIKSDGDFAKVIENVPGSSVIFMMRRNHFSVKDILKNMKESNSYKLYKSLYFIFNTKIEEVC